ncbi:hypothetical protein HX870_16275 [Pseudomonas gingeri]|uniref:hypothetical protein n=1 Tax=Pseudomonas gingeri TaxID=117681 RepID=UPI0015A2E6E4|nr:hypothetical protein [Pseudomonas gingeri]NWD69160.1 hypothetical protein [Pseudomonas gingeri]
MLAKALQLQINSGRKALKHIFNISRTIWQSDIILWYCLASDFAMEMHMSGRDSLPQGPSDPIVACEQLSFTTQIASPKDEVVEMLRVDYILDIVPGDHHGQSVVLALWEGQEVGGIADRRLQRLRQCMTEGTMYVARIVSITSGQVRVHIYPV